MCTVGASSNIYSCPFRAWKTGILLLIILLMVIKYSIDGIIYKRSINQDISPGLTWISRSLMNDNYSVNNVKAGKLSHSLMYGNSLVTNSTISSKIKTAIFLNKTQSDEIQITVNTASMKVRNLCPPVPPNLVARLKVLTNAPSFEELGKMFSNLDFGGRYKPPTCISRSKVALIIPYRDREEHLRIFLHNLHPVLQRQMLDYGIYVIEQSDDSKFNRGMLMNIGYVEALNQYHYECFIFHDVDLIPEDDRNFYSCPEQPRHMSVAINQMKYRLPYKGLFGGVCAMTKKDMETVDGFSNEFWGWGGEDDDMANRLKFHGLKIFRYPAQLARYTMLKHEKNEPNPHRFEKLYEGRSRFNNDGLSNLKYKRLDIVLKQLYTWVLVEIAPIKK